MLIPEISEAPFARLRSSFIGTLVAHSENPHKQHTKELGDVWWDQIVKIYSHRPYHNLDVVQQSLDMLPNFVKNATADMPLVLVAFILQWVGPASNPENNYPYYKLTKVLNWPEYRARQIQELAQIRLDLTLPKFAPKSTIYDLNLIRLGLPEKDFLQNQELALKNRHQSIGMGDFINTQRSIFEFLIKRGQIFCTQLTRDQYEEKAKRNITLYLDKVGRLKENQESSNLVLTS